MVGSLPASIRHHTTVLLSTFPHPIRPRLYEPPSKYYQKKFLPSLDFQTVYFYPIYHLLLFSREEVYEGLVIEWNLWSKVNSLLPTTSPVETYHHGKISPVASETS